jgi:hypothetical protein
VPQAAQARPPCGKAASRVAWHVVHCVAASKLPRATQPHQ